MVSDSPDTDEGTLGELESSVRLAAGAPQK